MNDLKKKLKSDDRQVIVTTIQKLQRLITKKLKEDTSEYSKITKREQMPSGINTF